MASPRQSPNLHPIKFTRNPELKNSHDDISQLFQNAEDDSSETGNKRSSVTCSSWFGEPDLMVYKLFYLFFYAATALFAYLPLYYKKSLLLDHHHVGILMGIRPFCGFLGAPIFGSFADKFNKYKSTLYTGLLTYIIVYLSITFVNGVPKDCNVQARINHTDTSHKHLGGTKFLNEEKQSPTLKVYNTEKFAQHLANTIAQRNDALLNNEQSRTSSPESSNIDKSGGNWKLLDKPVYFSEDVKQLPHGRVVFKKFNSNDQVRVDTMNVEANSGDMGYGIPDTGDNMTQVNFGYIIQILVMLSSMHFYCEIYRVNAINNVILLFFYITVLACMRVKITTRQ